MPIISPTAISPHRIGGKSWRTYWTQLKTLVDSKLTPKLTGNNSTFAGAGSWETGLGSLAADVTTIPGSMLLDFTSGSNQAVKIVGAVETGATHGYFVKIRCKIQAGAGTTLQIGSFAGTVNASYGVDIVPTTTMRWYYAYLHSFATTSFYIGVVAANNNGTDFLIDEIHIDECNLADLYSIDLSTYKIRNTTGLWSDLSRAAQNLLHINIKGDSVWSRSTTGAIPAANDEGQAARPPRLVTNNVIRQLYDKIKYTPPTYKRFYNDDKSLADGWAVSNALHWVWVADNLMFDDVTTGENCAYSQTANAYCEITVPDGMTNFALIYKTFNADLGQNYDDAIAVTLNGGDISAYGSATINSYNSVSAAKNVFSIAKYEGLPAGSNVIRFTKSNTVKTFMLWGGFYWNGNTFIIKNYSTGGSTIDAEATYIGNIQNYYPANSTHWVVEFPNINNSAQAYTAAVQTKGFLALLSKPVFDITKAVFINTHPFGTDPSDGTPNYYTQYNAPITFKQRITLDICLAALYDCYCVDVFSSYEADIIARGGTLAGGEAGTYFTIDGQHLNQDGADDFGTYMLPAIPLIPD